MIHLKILCLLFGLLALSLTKALFLPRPHKSNSPRHTDLSPHLDFMQVITATIISAEYDSKVHIIYKACLFVQHLCHTKQLPMYGEILRKRKKEMHWSHQHYSNPGRTKSSPENLYFGPGKILVTLNAQLCLNALSHS